MDSSNIVEFFKNQTIFITGGTGFLGKVLIEKLLRECYDLKKIYVMIRPKKGKSSEERFREIFDLPCFEIIRKKSATLVDKVFLVYGDCEKSFLGLDSHDLDVLKKEVTCVIHAAANVKFEQTLKEATCYVKATRDLLKIAKEMKNLKAFVYISTFYSNCPQLFIEEKLYDTPLDAAKLFQIVDTLDDDILADITPKILKEWPNAYTFTKSVTEDLVAREQRNFPVVIVRPAIVASSVSEPVPGWIDNFYGIVGISCASAMGVIRSINADPEAFALGVPVDFVCNCILASAWLLNKEKSFTIIYNYCGFKERLLTWQQYMDSLQPHCWEAATDKVIWYFCFKLRKNVLWHKICVFFMHTVPAHIVDTILFCIGKPPIAVKNYERLNKLLNLTSPFVTRQWTFDNQNVINLWDKMTETDKKKFPFDMRNIDLDKYFRDSVFGGRYFLLKDTPDTIPKGKRKLVILGVAHYTVIILLWYLLFKFVMLITHLF